jgi:hypothetical protein
MSLKGFAKLSKKREKEKTKISLRILRIEGKTFHFCVYFFTPNRKASWLDNLNV